MAMESTQCEKCPTTPRPCIFLHGLDNPNDVKELQDTPKLTRSKFGDMHGHAPCCSTIKYAVVNTIDAGWTNDTLQHKYCDYALSMSDSSDVATGTIDKTIVVTHSMGGLVMAHALATGKCRFSDTTSWVSLSPPMAGSMAVDYLMEFSSPSIDAAYAAAQKAYRKNVTAAMCSDSYVGLFSTYQAVCILAGTVIPHKSKKNDGLVEFDSCLGGLDENLFGNHYLDTFYRPKLNHADTAFLNGDGILKNSQKPRKWFECLQL
ncbi:uncharacterized protein PITG_05957 [Phytophthora infestans T30-4]|uniref:GPI inositol-deacylase n=1 Tax=Phytophthora infestans (strain T30-4) TaxID=403677 RepID=D0N639_PHYIT|nr:uncharacterized protein PITG_05957 [Phytophthora infestans T30-4]EEY70530.1 conserved hypothetical protein [Phytophthora infestans T30-4]|eukprot:XP_002998184.1 conserved hypothetical protein [Phytophthora infestans T30-4]